MQDEIMGSIYCQVSDDFQRGLFPIARTVKAECHDLAVIVRGGKSVSADLEKRIGNIYGFNGGNYAGNVYDTEMLSPTLRANSGGNTQPMIIDNWGGNNAIMIDTQGRTEKEPKALDECPTLRAQAHGNVPMIVASRGRNPDNPSDRTAGSPTEQRLEINTQGTSNCLTSVSKDNMVLENAAVLTPKRTEYGKSIRKAYESGEVHESRHNMTELEPRTDGVSNTLTTVQKDNMVLENSYEMPGNNFNQRNTVHSENGISRTVMGSGHAGNEPKVIDTNSGYRIRKLTPRECGRLMNVSDDDIDKMEKVNSNTQLFKQFGNSIVVSCLIAMFSNLHIKGVNAWEDMNGEERRNLICLNVK